MNKYREIRRPALSVLDEIPGSNTRRIVIHGTTQGAARNCERFYRLNPILGWSIRERRTLIGLLSRTPRSTRNDFARVKSANPGIHGAAASAQGVSTDVAPDPAQTGAPSDPAGGTS